VITTRNERQTQTDGERERRLHSYVAAEAKVRHLINICYISADSKETSVERFGARFCLTQAAVLDCAHG
jgi:hypothetical protein